jgi:hypothetical protein
MKSQSNRPVVTHDAIVRAVASSTAIETGQRIEVIEAKLRSKQYSVHKISLAFKGPVKPVKH